MTAAQRIRRDRAIVALAAHAAGIPCAQIARAFGTSRQNVAAMIGHVTAEVMANSCPSEDSVSTYREEFSRRRNPRKNLPPSRNR